MEPSEHPRAKPLLPRASPAAPGALAAERPRANTASGAGHAAVKMQAGAAPLEKAGRGGANA